MRHVAWCIAVLVGLGVAAELFARYQLGLGDPPLSRVDEALEYTFVGPRVYHRFGNVIAYNAFYQRSPEVTQQRSDANELRVLMLGDCVINGGSLTDQAELASAIIEQRLAADLGRPVIAMNASAGSWGPENLLRYVTRYGFFDADVVVIVVSNHDYADAETFEPIVGVSPDFPDRKPLLAIEEAVTRYLPRYLPSLSTPEPSAKLGDAQINDAMIERSMSAFRKLLALADARERPVIVALHPERAELDDPAEWPGHQRLNEAAQQQGATVIDLAPMYRTAVAEGSSVYRDAIHPTAAGQQLMARALERTILEQLTQR